MTCLTSVQFSLPHTLPQAKLKHYNHNFISSTSFNQCMAMNITFTWCISSTAVFVICSCRITCSNWSQLPPSPSLEKTCGFFLLCSQVKPDTGYYWIQHGNLYFHADFFPPTWQKHYRVFPEVNLRYATKSDMQQKWHGKKPTLSKSKLCT